MASTVTKTTKGGDLSAAIATAQNAERRTARDLIMSMSGEFAKALPKHLPVDQFMRLALTELRQNPALGDCTPESLLGALMTAARLGIEPGGPLGQFYLTPRRLGGRMSVVPIIGYRGFLELARRSGKVGAIDAVLIREGDVYEQGYDTQRGGLFTRWVPKDHDETRPVIGVLAFADLIGADRPIERYLPIDRVDARRDRGSAGEKGPWATDRDAMIRKTGLRYLAPVLPQSTALALAARVDEEVQTFRPGDAVDVSDLPAVDEPEADA